MRPAVLVRTVGILMTTIVVRDVDRVAVCIKHCEGLSTFVRLCFWIIVGPLRSVVGLVVIGEAIIFAQLPQSLVSSCSFRCHVRRPRTARVSVSRAVTDSSGRCRRRPVVGLLLCILIRFQAEIKRGPAQKRPPDRVGCFSGDDAGLGKRRSPTTEDTDPSKRTANRSRVRRRGPGVGRHGTAVSRARAAPTNCRITSSTWLSAGPLPERMCPVTSGISAARPCVTSIR